MTLDGLEWFDSCMSLTSPAKEHIVLAAERVLAERGLGASLRQIGSEAGNHNNSAVQYHFGSKARLIQAIFEYRLPQLFERRQMLIDQQRPADLRSWLECWLLPILEQAEREGSNYLTFVAMLQQHSRQDIFESLPEKFQASTRVFRERVEALLPQIPEPLRTHRIGQAMSFVVHAASDRERAHGTGEGMLSFAVFASDLFDALVGFLVAPVSPAAVAAVDDEVPPGFGCPPHA